MVYIESKVEETNMNYHELETTIGERIRFYRKAKNMSQLELYKKTDIPNSAISNYENGNQKPELMTVAKLATALEVSIDDLFFGDINERFIASEEDEAAVIVNCICKLWETGVLRIWQGENFSKEINHYIMDSFMISIEKYHMEIVRLLKGLRDYDAHKDSYSDAESVLKSLKESSANEIRKQLNKNK